MKPSIRAPEWAGIVVLVIAFLLPAGDAPWFSFWREWVASIAVLFIVLAAINSLRRQAMPLRVRALSVPAAALALAVLCWLQFAAGLLPYCADALLPSLYFTGFAICAVVAGSLPESERGELADRLAVAMLTAALLSAPLAFLQWLGPLTLDLGVPVGGGRPVAHMEQANLLCSLLVQGSLGAWRLIERRRIHRYVGLALCVPILLVVILSQSRVAWLVGFALLFVAVWRRDILLWRSVGRTLAIVVAFVVIGAALLPWLDAQIGLSGASLADRTSQGRRPVLWALFLDAVTVHPWTGWGVLQNGAAQFMQADRHPAAGYFFSSAHDVVLDLMVWFGAPVGLFVAVALLRAVWQRIALATDAAGIATAMAMAALVLHGLVEFPLEYAYFLLPLGLMLGASSVQPAVTGSSGFELRVGTRAMVPTLAIVPALILSQLASDYIKVTDIRPVLDVDAATGHRILAAQLPRPAVVLLDQLKGFHAFAATPLQTGLGAAELADAKTAMLRQPYAPSIERFALLVGINGDRASASDALLRLCKFEPTLSCEESQRAWGLWHQRWPQLPPWPAATPAVH
jgi:O-antigen ligase